MLQSITIAQTAIRVVTDHMFPFGFLGWALEVSLLACWLLTIEYNFPPTDEFSLYGILCGVPSQRM